MKIYKIYKITNRKNNKCYIGFTGRNNVKQRWSEHFKPSVLLRSESKFSRAIKKYGRNVFEFNVLLKTDNLQCALEKEVYYIKKFDSVKNGYNIIDVEQNWNEKHRTLISNHHADFSGENNPFYGKSHTKETRKLISNRPYMRGVKHHWHKKPTKTSFKCGFDHPNSISVIINGKTYGSISQASSHLGISRFLILRHHNPIFVNDDLPALVSSSSLTEPLRSKK